MPSDPNAYATYRSLVTGRVGVFPVRLGDNDASLERVPAGTKPLAWVSSKRKRRKQTPKPSGDAPRDQEEENNAPEAE